VGAERRGLDGVKLGEEVRHVETGGFNLPARGVHLDPIASGEEDGFARRSSSGERTECRFDPPHLKVHPLAEIDRRCPVADSNQKKMHALSLGRSGF